MHDPYRVEKRKQLTKKERLQLFLDCKGLCCCCGGNIGHKEWTDLTADEIARLSFIDEHVRPLWRDGTNEKNNRGVAHVACAREKTAEEATDRAKGRRVAEKHFGASRKGWRKPKGVTFDWKAGRYRRDGA